jgi:hypothetical protein
MVQTDITVIWEPKKSSLQKKFQRVVTECKDFGSKANLDKCVTIQSNTKEWKSQCNNMKHNMSFKNTGSKIVTNESINKLQK